MQNRRLDLLTISSAANLKADSACRTGRGPALSPGLRSPQAAPKPVVLLTARVHPGETPSSFVMHGAVTFLTSDHPAAQQLREAAMILVGERRTKSNPITPIVFDSGSLCLVPLTLRHD